LFWKHNLKKNSDETVEWKVDTGEDGDVPRRVLRKPLSLSNDDDGMGRHSMVMRVTRNYPHNERTDVLQECLHIVGVDDISSLISALKQYKDKEEKLNRIRLADEKLKEKQNEVKVTQKEKDNAVTQLTTSHSVYREVVTNSRSKPNKRKRNQRRKQKIQHGGCPLLDEQTLPERQRVSANTNS
jgi:hypothetical protein